MIQKLNPNNLLGNLDICLNALLLAAEKGEWETISDLSRQLLPALEAVSNAPDTVSYVRAEQIRYTLTLLQAAIGKCAERKEQIEPLVKALIPAKETPDTA